MNKTITTVVIIAALFVIGGAFYASNQSASPADMNAGLAPVPSQAADTATTPPSGTPTPSASSTSSDTSTPIKQASAVKEFTVMGKNFSFVPSTLTVHKGDTVKITFKNTQGFHDLRIDEFNAATQRIKTGAQETIQFIADKTGSFEYYCSVGTHRAMGMKGTLVVE